MEQLGPNDPSSIGEYRLLARLGAGGMGQVFLGRSPAGHRVAIKVVHEHLAADPRFRARFRREVSHARTVSGVFTAPVVDADPEAKTPWLATAYLPGLSLQEAVDVHGPFPSEAVFALGAGLAEGLESIHRAGLVHRDLKPSNVLLSAEGPRIIDFGIARAADDLALTRPGGVLGSPGYMSPEQASGRPTGTPSDVFSFGALLGFVATGRRVFGDGPLPVQIHRVLNDPPALGGVHDRELRDVIESCLNKDPRLRPTVARLTERLSHTGPPEGVGWLPAPMATAIRARRTEPAPPPRTGYRLRRRALIAGGVTAAVAAAFLGDQLVRPRPPEKRKPPPPTTPRPSGSVSGTAAPAPAGVLWRQRELGTFVPPVISRGTVFVTLNDHTVHAVDLSSGKRGWSTEIDGYLHRPVLAGDLLVFPIPRGVSSLRTADGKRGWTTSTSISYPPLFASGGLVFGAYQRSEKDGLLSAFDARTGAVRWDLETTWGTALVPMAAGAGLLYVTDGDLRAHRAATGAPVWTYPVDGLSLAAAGDTAYVSDVGGRLHAVRNGRKVWVRTVGNVRRPPLVRDGVIYLHDENGHVRALDAADGAERWTAPVLPSPAIELPMVSRSNTPLALSGRTLFAVGGEALHALDAADGTLLQRTGFIVPMSGSNVPSTAAADNVVLLCDEAGLTAFTGPS